MTEVEKKSKNKDYILAVASSVCKNITYPKKNDYVKAIIDLRSKDDKLINQTYSPEDIRSGISKAIDALIEEGRFMYLLNDEGKKYYVPRNYKYETRQIRDNIYNAIKDNVKIIDRDILIVSYNVCAIKAEPIGDIKIKELFRNCLGNQCFHILKNQTFLYIMLRDRDAKLEIPNEKSKEYMTIKALGSAIRKLYNIQNNISTKKVKAKLPIKNTSAE